MTRVTIDSSLQAKLTGTDPLILCTETGQVLGYFHPVPPPGTIKSPISDEELEELRKQRTGTPLADVLKRIGAT
ncbi:MAG TPA: hypothetical protein VFE46_16435 [Pirellulales bacterium]|jgi:hypothetical protein|nr:hypothetical protein [Pirellulales bacterium]